MDSDQSLRSPPIPVAVGVGLQIVAFMGGVVVAVLAVRRGTRPAAAVDGEGCAGQPGPACQVLLVRLLRCDRRGCA